MIILSLHEINFRNLYIDILPSTDEQKLTIYIGFVYNGLINEEMADIYEDKIINSNVK